MYTTILYLTLISMGRPEKSNFFYKSFLAKPVTRWLGVLRVKQSEPEETDAVTGIVAITTHHAIGVADEIATIDKINIRNTTQAAFYNTHKIPWFAPVSGYIIHPEYPESTLNSIGIVIMDPKSYNWTTMWNPIHWPTSLYNGHGPMSAVGYTDAREDFEQITYNMVHVDNSRCVEFYDREVKNYPINWPSNYLCAKDAKKYQVNCTYDAGMTLATNSSGQWTLIGISTAGPGCSLPSRFILFYPYTSWIRSVLKIEGTDPRRAFDKPITQDIHRRILTNITYNSRYSESLPWEPFEDRDTKFFLQQVDNNVWVSGDDDDEPVENITSVEDVKYLQGMKSTKWGTGCDNLTKASTVMYADKGSFKFNDRLGTFVYSMSIFDFFYLNVQCIKLKVDCLVRTKIVVTYGHGFEQEDLEFFIKSVPTNPGKVIESKILYLKEGWRKYRDIAMHHITFSIAFENDATYDLKVYGIERYKTFKYLRTTKPTTTTTTTVRPPRVYPVNLRHPKPKTIWETIGDLFG